MNGVPGTRTRRSLALSVALLAATFVIAVPAADAVSPAPVNLGTADPFAILSGEEITDSPTSSITGNVGLYPGTGAALGLVCAQVNGTIYDRDGAGDPCFTTDDPLLLLAKNALTAAFIDADARGVDATIGTELGGTTQFPGVYDSADTTFQISAGPGGPLVLDGQGDPNAVFIFQMDAEGTGLTVGPGSSVSLINGAQACNVFWVLDTATIDTTAVFKGNILALNSITVENGANIEGRLLARDGNVTLINDTIVRSVCAAAPGFPAFTG